MAGHFNEHAVLTVFNELYIILCKKENINYKLRNKHFFADYRHAQQKASFLSTNILALNVV
jgi:hypothetical protein